MQKPGQGRRARPRSAISQYCRNAHCSRIVRETRLAVTGATEVYRALCAPEGQRVGGYEIATRVVPARHVSGDFVCSVQCKQGTFLVLADLMGKGLSAAMWLTHIIDLVHRAADESQNVSELLGHLNQEVLHSRISAPLTSAIAILIGEREGRISCALAGHPPAVILRKAGAETITAGGPLLGVLSSAIYESQDVYLERGESLIAFSDGLSEAAAHEKFSMDNVLTAIAQDAESAPAETISKLLKRSTTFSSEAPLDDISILVLQRR